MSVIWSGVTAEGAVVPVQVTAEGKVIAVGDGLEGDYLKLTGGNLTGDLTLGTDKITLDATSGSATFASGAAQIRGTDGMISWNQPAGFVSIYGQREGTGTFAITSDGEIRLGGADPTDAGKTNILLKGFDGSAIFAGDVQVGGERNGKAQGVYTGKDGFIRATYSGSSDVFRGYQLGNTSQTSAISANGNATFKGDVVIGSRGEQWLIRESNGVAMLVKQSLRQPREEKLRDLPNELDLIEAALNEIMEKLRMTPPAGWPVWDGSDNA